MNWYKRGFSRFKRADRNAVESHHWSPQHPLRNWLLPLQWRMSEVEAVWTSADCLRDSVEKEVSRKVCTPIFCFSWLPRQNPQTCWQLLRSHFPKYVLENIPMNVKKVSFKSSLCSQTNLRNSNLNKSNRVFLYITGLIGAFNILMHMMNLHKGN